MGERHGLKGELDRPLEDAGCVPGGRDLAECGRAECGGTASGGCECAGGGAGGCIEIGVVEEIEGLEAELHGEALPDGEDARDLGVELIEGWSAEGVAAFVAVGTGCDGVGAGSGGC